MNKSDAIVYIAGPMTGKPGCNRPAFASVWRVLDPQFRVILTPHTLPAGLDYKSYLDITMAMVRACDYVYAMDGWQKSKGAKTELAYALALGKTIIGAAA